MVNTPDGQWYYMNFFASLLAIPVLTPITSGVGGFPTVHVSTLSKVPQLPAPQTRGRPELADTLHPDHFRALEPPTLSPLDALQSTPRFHGDTEANY